MRAAPKILAPILAVLILGGSAWGFVLVTRKVMAGHVQDWDHRVLLMLRDADRAQSPRGPLWIEHAARDVTALGSMTVIVLLTAAMTGFFFLVRRRRDGILLFGAIVSGMGVFFLLKQVVARQRPPLVSPLVYSETHSYPSGHVMLSAGLYFTLAILLCRFATQSRLRTFVWSIAVALTIVIAFTRTYLGIHWPSDVLAGLLAGIGWTALWWIIGWTASWRKSQKVQQFRKDSAIILPLLIDSSATEAHPNLLSVEGSEGSD